MSCPQQIDLELKLPALHHANERLVMYVSDFLLKNFGKLTQYAETIQKMFGKRVMALTHC